MYQKKYAHPKVFESVITFASLFPFYAEILNRANIRENNSIPTCYMCFRRRGLEIGYNKELFDRLTQAQVNFVLSHELKHAIAEHPHRLLGKHHETANVAEDCIINSMIDSLEVKKYPKFFEAPTDEKGKVFALYIPKEYPGDEFTEPLYEWLREQIENRKDKKKDKSEGDELSTEYGKNGKYEEETIGTQTIIDHLIEGKDLGFDKRLEDEMSPEEIDSYMDEIIRSARGRGLITSDIEQQLGKLRPKKKDYTKIIKRKLSFMMGGNKFKTWMRMNRRNLPLPGNKRLKWKFVGVLDTSGSMTGEIETVLSTLYRNDIDITLIQADTEVKKINKITSKYKFNRLKVSGFGGTILQPAVDLVKKEFAETPLVILTDGECDDLDFSGFRNKVLILYTENKVKTTGSRKVTQIHIDKN